MAPKKMGSPSDDAADASGDGHFRAGGFDPDLRVKDLDEDGVWGEVLYPTIALFGYLNRWNDTMATTLEDKALTVARRAIGTVGWVPGKHR